MIVNVMSKQILLSFEQDNDQKGISFKSLLKRDNHWHNQPFISYGILRKIWQYEILTALRKRMPRDADLDQIIDWCFTQRKNGFIFREMAFLRKLFIGGAAKR